MAWQHIYSVFDSPTESQHPLTHYLWTIQGQNPVSHLDHSLQLFLKIMPSPLHLFPTTSLRLKDPVYFWDISLK